MAQGLNTALDTYLEVRLSGGAANHDPLLSIGGAMSVIYPTPDFRGALFADVTAAQLAAGLTDYRCLYLTNTDASRDMANLTVWFDAQPASADTAVAMGLDTAGINVDAAATADETTAPSGVTFSTPTAYASGINIGTLTPGDYVALWLRRTVTAAGTARQFDRLRLGLQFD